MEKYNVGFTAGVYDLFHIGHLNLFKNCKKYCNYLIVGVLTDDYTEFLKARRPYISFEERIEIVKSICYVDEVVPVDFHNTQKNDAWRYYHFDVCFSGNDHEHDIGFIQEKMELNKVGSEMIFLPYTQSTSSTQIKQLISRNLL